MQLPTQGQWWSKRDTHLGSRLTTGTTMDSTYLSQTLQCLLLMGLFTRQELQKTLGLKPSSSASSMMVLYFTSWLVRTMPGSDRHDLRKLYLVQVGTGSRKV